ncbi:hypothetical protein [Lelliottia wanjuensis]|uniref:hypothetical protein n=1 Tax=Lelliottia wanjuensis TaxID=3050585 RepID=UPI00254AB37D|nr:MULTISPECIES: hypothetical protein [unclassified Lelliottia]MDK9355133.1 hypothetical protein [Lelliottia sp. V106_16]MDK9371801.1 hypothetical protein [Lelliottia sp. V106_10]MDK9583882.1 hypothetical protein [Lelliottia sp. V86_10]MDK9598978.1 hypothetical protein [Lelliottia sp. V106_5]
MSNLVPVNTMKANTLADIMELKRDEYRYLLIDPLKAVCDVRPIHLSHLQKTLGDQAIRPVLRQDLAYSPQHCPQLVLLATPGCGCDAALLECLVDYAAEEALHEKRYLCAWLSSPQPLEQLVVTLADWCNHLDNSAFFPFFEPHRFELLQATSPAKKLGGSIWPVSHWWYMSAAGNITVVDGNEATDKWQLTWGVQHAQQAARMIWQLLFAWQQVCPTLPSDAVKLAAAAWREVEKTELTHVEDRLFLALNRLTLLVNIELHPQINALLQQAIASPALRFTQLLNSLPESVWFELDNLSSSS